MGTLRSAVDYTGDTVNGVTLGEPFTNPATIDGDGLYRWDDGRLPTGEVIDGVLHPDDPDAEPVQDWRTP